jgi:hypothetical protein
MKKTLIIVLALSIVIAGVATASVVSSKHDLRADVTVAGRTITAAGSTGVSQVCVFCHHPHRGAGGGITSVLLWNISDVSQSYLTYSSPTANSTNLNGLAVTNATSLLCMGCHDGADNSFIRDSAEGSLGTLTMGANNEANLGETLVDDHPIEFDYPTAVAFGNNDIRLATAGEVRATNATYPLFSGTMQCSTCHNVHMGDNSASTQVQFMRGNVTNSELCIDCHTAK